MEQVVKNIEAQILLQLDTLKRENGGYLSTLTTYSTRNPRESLPPVVNLPAVIVCYQGGRCQGLHDGGWEIQCQWKIYAADNVTRSDEARRYGTTSHPGTYKMLEDLKSKLVNQVLLDFLHPLQLLEERLEESNRERTLYSQLWSTRFLELPDA